MEVSPRDGLQYEGTMLTTEQKLQLIDNALNAGCKIQWLYGCMQAAIYCFYEVH